MMRFARRTRRKYSEDGFGRLLVDGTWYVGSTGRRTSELTRPVIYRLAREYYRRKYLREREIGSYDHPPDPTKVVWIDPDRITYRTMRRPESVSVDKPLDIGGVEAGNWDATRWRFDQSAIYWSLRERYVRGKDWKETEVVRVMIPPWNRDSAAAIERKCERMDQLWESLQEDGYRTQRELWKSNPEQFRTSFLPDLLVNEITVDVGRDGELLFVDSYHRLSMAKLLGLDSIPVTVLVRHPEWMDYRDSVAETGDTPDHPDLRDLG